ncbi:MAG: cation:proton antiporter, partial [Muribaculaceae bacterium]|nr:cation:proton antiporter [Muribaculaceae bacterium]
MISLTIFSSTPLVTSPVTIFLIVLVIILLAPVVLNRLKIPHIIGMIVAGVVVGPYGLNILDRDSSFNIFGQVGLLYLMFLAGLEIDMFHLRLNLKRGAVFGILTFLIPLVLGVTASVYILHTPWVTAFLLASMYASHTLIAYPVASRFGITKSPAVLISVVATIVCVIGALLILAAAVNIHETGSFSITGLLWLLGKSALYCVLILYAYPRITRFFFKNYSEKVTQYLFIMVMVFLSAWLSGVIGLEPVLGAFFAGIVLNRYVPASSPLMNSIEFVGNALFIPYFLIGVGMMINLSVIVKGNTLWVAAVMLAVAIAGKWLAAYAAQKIYRMHTPDRQVMFGLTTAHTAVALAVVTIGYNMVLPDGSRMMDETILNGTVLVILVTCAIAPIVTSSAAAKIKVRMLGTPDKITDTNLPAIAKILIPVANPITAASLAELALLMRRHKDGIKADRFYALHVRNDNSRASKEMGANSLALAKSAASGADIPLETIERYDLNTVAGILNTIQERDITTVVMGMHRKANVIDTFLGSKVEQLIRGTNLMIVLSRCYIPVNTVTRIVVFVPPKAEYEHGFRQWVEALAALAHQIGCRLILCADTQGRTHIAATIRNTHLGIRHEYRPADGIDDFMLLSNRVLDDDLLVVIAARRDSVSYTPQMTDTAHFLQLYLINNSEPRRLLSIAEGSV